MLYYIRVEPLSRDVKPKEVKELFGDFGQIHRVSIHRASPFPRYNRITKVKDIFDATYAVVSYIDRRACRMAVMNFHNTLKHPITQQFYSIIETVKMGQAEVRRSIQVREHVQNSRFGA